MNLPFTPEQFFAVFARYNEAIWPMQVVLNAAALVCIVLLFRPGVRASQELVRNSDWSSFKPCPAT